jgi:hypothetical protein
MPRGRPEAPTRQPDGRHADCTIRTLGVDSKEDRSLVQLISRAAGRGAMLCTSLRPSCST